MLANNGNWAVELNADICNTTYFTYLQSSLHDEPASRHKQCPAVVLRGAPGGVSAVTPLGFSPCVRKVACALPRDRNYFLTHSDKSMSNGLHSVVARYRSSETWNQLHNDR